MKKYFLQLIGFLVVSGNHLAWSGGPLEVYKGVAMTWPEASMPVPYIADQGGLGPLSHSEAVAAVDKAFQVWQNVDNIWLKFSDGGELSTDVTGSNYSTMMNTIPAKAISAVFDQDGSIIETVYGGSDSKSQILGFARPEYSTYSKTITGYQVVFNGWFYNNEKKSDGSKYTKSELFSTLIHEFGHACGLDHTQIFRHLAWDGMGGDDTYVPIMFPTNTDDESLRQSLTFDDINALTALYANNASGSYGKITGKVTRGTQEMPGVNVIARKVGDPFKTVTSTVTGTSAENGSFEFNRLPAGDYEIMVEPIYPEFSGSSSVGQYAGTSSGASFSSPVRPEFYNAKDIAVESRSVKTAVTVRAGQTVSNINLVVSGTSMSSEEQTSKDQMQVELLALDSTDGSGAAASMYSGSAFMLDLLGTEKKVFIEVEFEKSSKISVEIRLESNTAKRIQIESKKLTATIGEGGEIALQKGRYFITIANGSTVDQFFTIRALLNPSATGSTPTPVPMSTFTPTPKISTPTKTLTPTKTFTPTKTPIPTKTPTNIPVLPTQTPTPVTQPTSTPSPTPTAEPVGIWWWRAW